MQDDPAAAQAAVKNAALASNVIRASGAVIMLLGTSVGFNVAGIAGIAGIADGMTEKIAGGALFFVGLLDFFVMPQFLASKINRQ